jgi:hypothetical protein
MPPVEFEPTISAGERPQTYALDRAATAGTDKTTDFALLITDTIYIFVKNKQNWACLCCLLIACSWHTLC